MLLIILNKLRDAPYPTTSKSNPSIPRFARIDERMFFALSSVDETPFDSRVNARGVSTG
jgi:hypothetical protein